MLTKMSDKVDNIAKALIKSQSSISNVVKDKTGYNFKYGDLPQVLDIIKSAITPNELSFIQLIGPVFENKVTIESLLLHSSGEFISCISETYIEEDEKKIKMRSRVQNVGASVTYLRRKSALAFFSIAEEDEIDSHKESERPTKNFPLQAVSNSAVPRNPEAIKHPITPETLGTLNRLVGRSSVPAITGNTILEKSSVQSLDQLTETQAKVWIKKLQEASEKQAQAS